MRTDCWTRPLGIENETESLWKNRLQIGHLISKIYGQFVVIRVKRQLVKNRRCSLGVQHPRLCRVRSCAWPQGVRGGVCNFNAKRQYPPPSAENVILEKHKNNLWVKDPTPAPPLEGRGYAHRCWTRPLGIERKRNLYRRTGYKGSGTRPDPTEGRGYAHRLLDKTSWHRKRNGIFMKEQVTDWTPYFKKFMANSW